MRLIDADAMMEKKAPQLYIVGSKRSGKHYMSLCRSILQAYVDSAPTIDAVPVVRCRECVLFNEKDKFCRGFEGFVREDDFCSYGERKEGAD